MSTDSERPPPSKIVLTYAGEEWVARDENTGLTGRGETRGAALSALDDAIDQSEGEERAIPADDPLLSAGCMFTTDDGFDTRDIDDVLYDDTDR